MNLEYRKVSLFEYIYGKKINFSLIFKFFEMHLYIETCHYIVRTIVQKRNDVHFEEDATKLSTLHVSVMRRLKKYCHNIC